MLEKKDIETIKMIAEQIAFETWHKEMQTHIKLVMEHFKK